MNIRKIVILSRGLAGNIVAAHLAFSLQKTGIKICLLELASKAESCEHWHETYGASSLLPQTQIQHELLQLDEKKILQATGGTFNLGINYQQWNGSKASFIQPYENPGVNFQGIEFQHYFAKYSGIANLPGYDSFSLSAQAAHQNKFSHPNNDTRSILSTLSYGLNIGNKAYSNIYKTRCKQSGVDIIQTNHFIEARQDESGAIKELVVENNVVDGDFFIDCSGAASLLLGKTLSVKEIGWSHYFHSNKKINFIAKHNNELPSAIALTAKNTHWERSIPLQTHSVNTLVFNDNHYREADALSLASQKSADNNFLVAQPTKHGRKDKAWYKNVIAFGEAAASFEPMSISAVDILYRNIQDFLALLPSDSDCTLNAAEYNRQTTEVYDTIRDYQLCHHTFTAMQPSDDLWENHISQILPDKLKQRIDLFKTRGTVVSKDREMIPKSMWITLMIGLGAKADSYDPLVDSIDGVADAYEKIQRMADIISQTVKKMPPHYKYLERYLNKNL